MVNATPRPLYPRKINPAAIVQEAGRGLGEVLIVPEKFALTGAQTPDRQAHNESLYHVSDTNVDHLDRQLSVVEAHSNEPLDFIKGALYFDFFFNGSTAPWGPRPPHFSRLHDHTF
jgi:hypothetical protein